MDDEERYERLRRLYAKLPAIRCKGRCSASCGVIVLQQIEYDAISAKRAIPATPPGVLFCPLLRARRCSAYDVRPLICRLWGLVKSDNREWMRCPHGCKPSRWLSDAEAFALIDEAIAIDGRTRVLQSWIDEVGPGADALLAALREPLT